MSLQGKQLEFWEFPNEPCDVGKKTEKLKRSAPQATKDVTTSLGTQLSLWELDQPSYTPEFPLLNSTKTSHVKVNFSNLDILQANLLQRLDADSTTSGRSLSPYWNELCQAMSSVLWSHTKTGLPGSALTFLPGSVPNTLVNSWFSTKLSYLPNAKWLKTSWQSSTAFQPDSTDLRYTGLKSQKIRIYPSPQLHQIWKTWLAANRYCFNQAIAYQRSNQRLSKYSLRKVILEQVPQWVKECPYSFRVQAVYEAHQAFTNSVKSGTPREQAGKFRSCRDRIQSLQFREEDYKAGTWFKDCTKGLSFIASEPLPVKDVEFEQKQKDGSYKTRVRKESWDSATQLVYDKKRWFAVFSVSFVPEKSQSIKFIALDPGVRSFLTGFDGEKFVEVGNRDITRIYRLGQHADKLISQKAKLKGSTNKRTRSRLSQKINRLLVRVRNLIDEVHKKTAKYLISEYKLIFLPTFETSQMVAKETRKIKSKTVRQMLRWSHYRFKTFLRFQAFKRGAFIIDVTEEYTSKTCTACGHVHEKLGGRKVFKCRECGHKLLRDQNGALGIFLKALRDTASVIENSVTVLCPDSSNKVQA